MALEDFALTTLSRVKGDLQIDDADTTHDAYLEDAITDVSDEFRRLVDRAIHYDAAAVAKLGVEPGSKRLTLTDHRPVVSVTSITFDGGAVAAADYELESGERGWIRHKSGAWPASTVITGGNIDPHPEQAQLLYEVTYEGGWITPAQDAAGVGTRNLPRDIERAVIRAVVNEFRQRGRDETITSMTVLGDSWQRQRGSDGAGGRLERVAGRYREVTVL